MFCKSIHNGETQRMVSRVLGLGNNGLRGQGQDCGVRVADTQHCGVRVDAQHCGIQWEKANVRLELSDATCGCQLSDATHCGMPTQTPQCVAYGKELSLTQLYPSLILRDIVLPYLARPLRALVGKVYPTYSTRLNHCRCSKYRNQRFKITFEFFLFQ